MNFRTSSNNAPIIFKICTKARYYSKLSTAKISYHLADSLLFWQINLLHTLPEADRTKERLAEILEERKLTFLFPLLRIQSDLWKQLKSDGDPNNLQQWIKDNLSQDHANDPGFISALATVIIKYITEVGRFC